MGEQDFDREVLGRVDPDRRTIVKRLVVDSAFAVPLVSSYEMSSLTMSAAGAQTSNMSP